MRNKENFDYEVAFRYLDKVYVLEENSCINTHTKTHEWGLEIVFSLVSIFSINVNVGQEILIAWLTSKGGDLTNFDFKFKELNTNWGVNYCIDLEMLGVSNPELNLCNKLVRELGKEIDVEILKFYTFQSLTEMLSVIKCIGYERVDNLHAYNFNGFRQIRLNETKDERNNNDYWKNWVRTTRLNQKT